MAKKTANTQGDPLVEATLETTSNGNYKPVIATNEQRLFVITLFARGYTIRYIRTAIQKHFGRVPREDELMRLALDYSDDVEQVREDLAAMALTRGLAAKEERILRLTEMAEAWEGDAIDGTPIYEDVMDPTTNQPTGRKVMVGTIKDPRAAKVYLDTIKQVKEEVEPLGLQLLVPPSDPWGKLLLELQEASQQQMSQQSTNLERQLQQKAESSEEDQPDQK